MAKLFLYGMTLHYFVGVGAALNAPAIPFVPDPRQKPRTVPTRTEEAPPASAAKSGAPSAAVPPGPMSAALGLTRAQPIDPAARLDAALTSAPAPGSAPGSIGPQESIEGRADRAYHPLEIEGARAKRNAHHGTGHRAANMQTPIKWSSNRPSVLSQMMFGAAPTREYTYRLAIKEKGLDPDQKYHFTDHWQTFSQNMMTANFRTKQALSHVQIALDSDTNTLPFVVRRTPNDLYLPGEALFNDAYREHITRSKELGATLIRQELSSYGVPAGAHVDFITVSGHTGGTNEPIAGGLGFIFKVKSNSGSRYFAITPLSDDMVFPIPESADLQEWISHNAHLFFSPETDFSEIRSYNTRTKEHHISLLKAVGYAVTPMVEHALNKLKRLAYGETTLQEFIHMARGICDPTGIYDIKRALELEDYTTLTLNIGAMLFPKVREGGGMAIKFITRHTRWLKKFVKGKVRETIANAPGAIDDIIDTPVEQGLNVRSVLGLDHGDPEDAGIEQSKTSERQAVHLSHAAKHELNAIDTLIRNDDWVRENVVDTTNADPLRAILHMKEKLLKAGYKSEVLAMLVWKTTDQNTTEEAPQIHYAVTARRFGNTQDFVIDAPIGSFDRFGIQGIQVASIQSWEKAIHDKAKRQIPHGVVKYRVFRDFREAQDTFQPSGIIASTTNLGDRTIVLHRAKPARSHKYVVTARPHQS